jgi:hypothetical protein
MSDAEDTVAHHIADFGWAVTMVPEDDEGPGFAYTTGLTEKFGHPELLIQGLQLEVMHGVLNLAGERVRDGVRFLAGQHAEDLLDGFACGLRTVDVNKHREYLGVAVGRYGLGKFDVLQILWPDKENHLPTDDACAAAVRRAQELAL